MEVFFLSVASNNQFPHRGCSLFANFSHLLLHPNGHCCSAGQECETNIRSGKDITQLMTQAVPDYRRKKKIIYNPTKIQITTKWQQRSLENLNSLPPSGCDCEACVKQVPV